MHPHNQKGRPLGCPLPLCAARGRRQHMTPAVVAAYAVVCDGCLVSSSALSNLSQCHYSTSESALLCTLCLSTIFLQPLEFWRPSRVYLKYSLYPHIHKLFSHAKRQSFGALNDWRFFIPCNSARWQRRLDYRYCTAGAPRSGIPFGFLPATFG